MTALDDMKTLTPKKIVNELDRYIIRQDKAKRAVAVAIRNRFRRLMLEEELAEEINPKNIIMIGPTGVGKTEIARRLAHFINAPFIKVEATKFTEVGYVGRDVESMVRDLTQSAFEKVKRQLQEEVRKKAETIVEEKILDILLPPPVEEEAEKDAGEDDDEPDHFSIPDINEDIELLDADDTESDSRDKELGPDPEEHARYQRSREKLREKLRKGDFEDTEIEISTSESAMPNVEVFSNMGLEEMDFSVIGGALGGAFPKKTKRKKKRVADARKHFIEEESEKLIDMEYAKELAVKQAEQMGIIFIDEIDKITAVTSGKGGGPDVSREGVQRDILPIVEGTAVKTRYGNVRTDHILFIASGAFHYAKPSDLIPELQGRFPIRVELENLKAADFKQILIKPRNALVKQYEALIGTEGVSLKIAADAVTALAELAYDLNMKHENIGARRLHTILEALLDDISFEAPERRGETVKINAAYVREKLATVVKSEDLSKYVL